MSLQENESNISQYIQSIFTVLNTPNAKNSQSIIDSFKVFLSKTFPSKEKTQEMFDIIGNFIFQSDNNKIIKDPFILFPIIFSSNPKLSKCYIDKMLNIISKTVNDNTRPLFSFISQIFGQVINSLYTANPSNSTMTLSKEEQISLYNSLLQFCIDNIKQSKKNEQICGCLYLTELIENCPFTKENDKLKSLWEIICFYIDDKNFYAKLEILNCLISLIFAVEKKFKPFATVALFKILDFLTDSDWMKRKLALNVVYTLSFYCKEEIFPLKEHIIEFLNVLKSDKVAEVKEVCLQTLKFLQENQDGYEEMEKAQTHNPLNTNGNITSFSEGSSKRERENSVNNLNSSEGKRKKKVAIISGKKKQKSSSLPKREKDQEKNFKSKNEPILTQSSSLLKFNRKNINKVNFPTPMVTEGGSHVEKINQLKKEKQILEKIEKEILDRRAKTPIQNKSNNKQKQNQSPHFNKSDSDNIKNYTKKNEERPKTPNHQLDSNFTDNVKIKVIKSNSLNKSINNQSEKIINKINRNDSSERNIKVNLKVQNKGKKEEKKETKEENVENTSVLLEQKLKSSLREEKKKESPIKQNLLLDDKLLNELQAQIKKLTEAQNAILSTLKTLSNTVDSNYNDLNNRLSKVEHSVSELSNKSQSKDITNRNLKKENIDENWQKISDAIKKNNFTLALNLSVVKDDYLFRTISQMTSTQVKSVDSNTIEDVLSRLIALIPRGEHLDEMTRFCYCVLVEKIKIKPLTKQNLKDVIGYLFKNKNIFKVSEETNKTIDNLKILLSTNSISNI